MSRASYAPGLDEWVTRRRAPRTRVGLVFDVFFERRMLSEAFQVAISVVSSLRGVTDELVHARAEDGLLLIVVRDEDDSHARRCARLWGMLQTVQLERRNLCDSLQRVLQHAAMVIVAEQSDQVSRHAKVNI